MTKRKIIRQPHLDSQKAPKALDIIRVDGRWAQIGSDWLPDACQEEYIRYLGTTEETYINPRMYAGVRYTLDRGVRALDEKRGLGQTKPMVLLLRDKFSERELHNIHWPDDAANDLNLKLCVHVWGELNKIKK